MRKQHANSRTRVLAGQSDAERTWQQVVHTDRIRALSGTDPSDVRVQPVDGTCWRVVNASAAWGDPEMLIGFVERTADGFDCTLMAALHERRHTSSLQAAHEYFEHQCGGDRCVDHRSDRSDRFDAHR